jgi:hypothetical protein
MENPGGVPNDPPRKWKRALALGIVIGLAGGYLLAWLTFLVLLSSSG